jgi:hypothetical protein
MRGWDGFELTVPFPIESVSTIVHLREWDDFERVLAICNEQDTMVMDASLVDRHRHGYVYGVARWTGHDGADYAAISPRIPFNESGELVEAIS